MPIRYGGRESYRKFWVCCDGRLLCPLDRCMMDTDDEVRDRATFYLNVLQQRQMALNATYIFNGQWEPRTGQITPLFPVPEGCFGSIVL